MSTENTNGSAEGVWWCNSHGRQATHINKHGNHCCDPKLGGILLPCAVIFAPIQILLPNGKINEVTAEWLRYKDQSKRENCNHTSGFVEASGLATLLDDGRVKLVSKDEIERLEIDEKTQMLSLFQFCPNCGLEINPLPSMAEMCRTG